MSKAQATGCRKGHTGYRLFMECGEICLQAFDVTAFPLEEVEGEREKPHPKTAAGIGSGAMPKGDAETPVGYSKRMEDAGYKTI